MNPGIEKAFKQLEIQYDILYYQQTDWEEDAIFEEKIEKQIQDNVYDAVFSVNFAPVISKVCQHRGIRYISWVYDSPMMKFICLTGDRCRSTKSLVLIWSICRLQWIRKYLIFP